MNPILLPEFFLIYKQKYIFYFQIFRLVYIPPWSNFRSFKEFYTLSCVRESVRKVEIFSSVHSSSRKLRFTADKTDPKSIDKPLEQKTVLAAHCTLTGHVPNFKDIDVLMQENHYKKRYTLEMLHIINVSLDIRMNYKSDTEHGAQLYQTT